MEKDLKLISDIYQYKVDRRVSCRLKIPVYTGRQAANDRYTDTIVVQTTDEDSKCTNVDIKNGYVCIAVISPHKHRCESNFMTSKINCSDNLGCVRSRTNLNFDSRLFNKFHLNMLLIL